MLVEGKKTHVWRPASACMPVVMGSSLPPSLSLETFLLLHLHLLCHYPHLLPLLLPPPGFGPESGFLTLLPVGSPVTAAGCPDRASPLSCDSSSMLKPSISSCLDLRGVNFLISLNECSSWGAEAPLKSDLNYSNIGTFQNLFSLISILTLSAPSALKEPYLNTLRVLMDFS